MILTSGKRILQTIADNIRSFPTRLQEKKSLKAVKRLLDGHTKLHLACGSNILDGWANVDLTENPKVIRHDLTRPLPVKAGTVRFIFSEHFIEHLTLDQGRKLLRESHRMLVPGGILRISTPNLGKIIDEYLAGRISEWNDVGFFPATPCRMVNEGMRRWDHQFIYDAAELEILLRECGFRNITHVGWHESDHQELRNLECRPFHGEIIVEAEK